MALTPAVSILYTGGIRVDEVRGLLRVSLIAEWQSNPAAAAELIGSLGISRERHQAWHKNGSSINPPSRR